MSVCPALGDPRVIWPLDQSLLAGIHHRQMPKCGVPRAIARIAPQGVLRRQPYQQHRRCLGPTDRWLFQCQRVVRFRDGPRKLIRFSETILRRRYPYADSPKGVKGRIAALNHAHLTIQRGHGRAIRVRLGRLLSDWRKALRRFQPFLTAPLGDLRRRLGSSQSQESEWRLPCFGCWACQVSRRCSFGPRYPNAPSRDNVQILNLSVNLPFWI